MKVSPYSQFDQDIWALNQLNNKIKGFFVEVGAYQQPDGRMSNTLLLEQKFEWSGILIEPNKNTFKNLESRSAIKLNVAASDHNGHLNFCHGRRGCDSMVSSNGEKMQCFTLNHILKKNNSPKVIDFLSVDVEGHELYVLSGLDFSAYHVNCAVIEHQHNGTENLHINDIEEIMIEAGFVLEEQTKCDFYFKNQVQK